MNQLAIHTLMHVPYEGLGCIENWINKNGHKVSYTKFYENAEFPSLNNFDMLIIMGGPMSVYEEDQYNWLKPEKEFINATIKAGKKVLGICLGSQLLAEALGASVYPNNVKEIGWYDIEKTKDGKNSGLLRQIPDRFTVFHWHGDTYDIPENSIHLFKTNSCSNQAFIYNNNVVALQFHFEVTEKTLSEMVENGMNELVETATTQNAKTILNTKEYIASNNRMLYSLLDELIK